MFLAKMLIRSILMLAVGLAGSAHAQVFPSRTVSIVAPYPAGGTPALVARILAEKMATIWGRSVIVKPKPGANGEIGTEYVKRSPADGYTLLLATLSHVTTPFFQKVPYDPVRDFSGVAEFATAPLVAVIPVSLPVTSMQEFVEYARKSPHKLNYLMPGIGTSMHLNTEMLKIAAKIDLVAIPYKGTPSGLPSLLRGDLSFAMLPLSTAIGQLKSGKLRALAVVSPKRLALIPEIPTLSETGYSEAQVLSWYAILAPARTPTAVVAKINETIIQALADPNVRERLQKIGVYASDPTTPGEVDNMLKIQTARWAKVFSNHKFGG